MGIFAIITVQLLIFPEDVSVERIYSKLPSGEFECVVAAADVAAGPAWNDRLTDAPLSMVEAVKIAQTKLVTLKLRNEAASWSLDCITLCRHKSGGWYYVVDFTRPHEDQNRKALNSTGVGMLSTGRDLTPKPYRLRIPVLLSGKVPDLKAPSVSVQDLLELLERETPGDNGDGG